MEALVCGVGLLVVVRRRATVPRLERVLPPPQLQPQLQPRCVKLAKIVELRVGVGLRVDFRRDADLLKLLQAAAARRQRRPGAVAAAQRSSVEAAAPTAWTGIAAAEAWRPR